MQVTSCSRRRRRNHSSSKPRQRRFFQREHNRKCPYFKATLPTVLWKCFRRGPSCACLCVFSFPVFPLVSDPIIKSWEVKGTCKTSPTLSKSRCRCFTIKQETSKRERGLRFVDGSGNTERVNALILNVTGCRGVSRRIRDEEGSERGGTGA